MNHSLAHETGTWQRSIRTTREEGRKDTTEPTDGLFAPPTPTCNTGVESASPRPPRPTSEIAAGSDTERETLSEADQLTATVDYLRITFPQGNLEEFLELFGGNGLDWKHEERGRNFYRKRATRDHITVLYDGAQPGMGLHVELTGQGCRQAEAEGNIPCGDWAGFLGFLRRCGGKLTRLDVALDDREGLLQKDVLRSHYRERQFACRAQGKSVRLLEDLGEGFTLYLGSRTSSKMIRIYDKAAQTGEPGHWMRCELETRDEAANALADQLAAGKTPTGTLVAGAIRGYVRFTVGDQVQACRREEATWWTAFLRAAAAVKLTIEPKLRSLEKAHAWLVKQVAPTLAVIALEAGAYGQRAIKQLIADGKKRLNSVHWQMLGFVGHKALGGGPGRGQKVRKRYVRVAHRRMVGYVTGG